MYYLAFGMVGNIPSWGCISLNVFVGLPSAVICMWGSTLANAALFALIFPSVGLYDFKATSLLTVPST
jgi:uncharacterized membrane protein